MMKRLGLWSGVGLAFAVAVSAIALFRLGDDWRAEANAEQDAWYEANIGAPDVRDVRISSTMPFLPGMKTEREACRRKDTCLLVSVNCPADAHSKLSCKALRNVVRSLLSTYLIDSTQDDQMPDLIFFYVARKQGPDHYEFAATVRNQDGEELYRASRSMKQVTMSNVGSIDAITFHYPMLRIVQEARHVG